MVNDYKDVIGGAELYLYNLSKSLQKEGYEIEYFFSNASLKDSKTYSQKQPFLKMLQRIFNIHAYFRMKKFITLHKPDIIHMHGILNELSPSILQACKNIPVIMTVHNNLIVNAVSTPASTIGKPCKTRICPGCINCVGIKGAIYEYIKHYIHKKLFKRISLYICPSQYMYHFLQEASFSPIAYIPNGINPLTYVPIKNFHELLYVGRLTKDKGVEYLLKAMPEVIKRFSRCSLTLVGSGVDESYFHKLTQTLKIAQNVKFVGAVTSNELQKYYQRSTIVIVPSIYNDNFPTVCLEAMSVGRPVIGTRMGGIPELIEDGKTGWIVAPESSFELSAKIQELLANRESLQRMSYNQKEKFPQFSLDKHTKKIVQIYQTLYNRKNL